MRTLHLVPRTNLDQHHALSVLAGWKPSHPSHRLLEAERIELNAIAERDNEARMAAARRVAR